MYYPNHYYVASGKGVSQHKLVSFDNALIHAGISNYNILRVSSILPAGCKLCHSVTVRDGSPLLAAYATASSNIIGDRIATAIAVGVPVNAADIGIIMEASGESSIVTEEEARNMVAESMENHGIPVDYIVSSSIEGVVNDGWLSLISAIALW